MDKSHWDPSSIDQYFCLLSFAINHYPGDLIRLRRLFNSSQMRRPKGDDGSKMLTAQQKWYLHKPQRTKGSECVPVVSV